MAHFAEINDMLQVVRVLVVSNSQEHRGQDFLANDLGLGGRWIQTSYNGNIRKNFASVGMSYNESLDAFIPEKPFNSWVLNEFTCLWEAPIPYPEDGNVYVWSEINKEWVLVN